MIDEGRWLVRTETSAYELDLDASTVIRLPGEGAGAVQPVAPRLATLRRDTETLPLLTLAQLEVGQPMEMFIQVRDDDVATYRRTTIVQSIERL